MTQGTQQGKLIVFEGIYGSGQIIVGLVELAATFTASNSSVASRHTHHRDAEFVKKFAEGICSAVIPDLIAACPDRPALVAPPLTSLCSLGRPPLARAGCSCW